MLNVYFWKAASKRAHDVYSCCPSTCVVFPALEQHWALWPPAYGKKEEEATLTFDDKRPKSPNGDFHFAPLPLCLLLLLFSCVQLFCDPMDYSPSGSSVHEIFQTRVLEWVTISFSRRSSQPRDWTPTSCAVNTEVHVSFCIIVLFEYMPIYIQSRYRCTLSRSICPVEFLDHLGTLFLAFWGTSILFSIVDAAFYIPTYSVRGFPFLHTLTNLYCL